MAMGETPPPSASASAAATRLAAYWTADALADDEAFEFSVIQALVRTFSESLAGVPEATRDRLALRGLHEVSYAITAEAATPGPLGVHDLRSCLDLLLRLITDTQVGSPGNLENDLLLPFSQDILETVLTKKHTLPETSFQLLKGLDPQITSMDPPSQLKHNGSLPAGNTTEDTMVFEEQNAEKTHFEVSGASKANQTLHDDGSILKNDMVHSAFQGSKSDINLQPGNATENTVVFEEQNADKSHLEVSGVHKANQTLHDDGSILKNSMVHGGLTAQTAPVSQNCNVTLQGKTSEAKCFSEQKNEERRTDVQKDNGTSIPCSSHDGDGENAKKTSNEEKFEDTSPEIDINDTPEGLSLQDLCIKCGKDGQLLKCSGCSLVGHDSCFGSSVTFEGTDLFYCPLCVRNKAAEAYKKAKETYLEARKNAAAFLATTQVVKQHDEQLNGVQRGAAKRDGHPNGSVISKENSILQNEAYEQLAGVQSGAANRDGHSTRFDMSKRKSINPHEENNPESHEQRKKQKTNASNGKKQNRNARGSGYPKEALTEKVPFQNSGLASMNKHSLLQNNNNTRVNSSEKEQQVRHTEACKESGNGNLSHDKRASSANQDVEADQEDGCDEKNDFGKRSSPRKKHYACQNKRYCNPVGPVGRRRKRYWTEEEQDFLRKAMKKKEFKPKAGETIPWVQILEYGRGAFDRTRQPDDLRVKWRSMMKKSAGK